MANRITSLLANTKTRTMVLLVVGVLIFGVVIAVSQTESKGKTNATTGISKTTEVPGQIKSTPGSDVTRKYQELQEKANIRGAEEAAKKGTTFIPTLTGKAEGYSDKDFSKQLTNAFDSLGGKCSKEKVAELSKSGLTTTQIIMQLKSYGCSAAAIASLFTPDQIAAAFLAEKACNAGGCTADVVKQFRAQGNDDTKVVAMLKNNGCNTSNIVKALKESGVNTNDIVAALKANDISTNDIVAALKANDTSIDQITSALKANGVDAVTIASALEKAGFNKNDVVAALTKSGFSAVEVAKALTTLNAQQQAALLAQQSQSSLQRVSAQDAQQLAAYSQQRQGKIQELVAAMENEKKQAMDAWIQVPQQQFTQGEWVTKKAQAEADGMTMGFGKGKNASPNDGKVILKAGSILFAVLDTSVDSDQQGPVLATIVSGSLKGAKLMGSMTKNNDSETISLNFTSINMPNEANSMGISAVAIDPDTARTALASDVDHHYLYRWGSLFASSFVQGFASAVANSGSTSTTSQGAAGVTTTTSSPALDSKQQLFSGIAAVGTKWSQVVGKNFDRPITVTIDQGTGLGILITSDLVYGSNPIFYTPPTTSTTTASAPTSTVGTGQAAANNIPGTLGDSGALTNDQRQALWNILQNQPVTTQAAGSSTVTTTTTVGGAKQ